MTAAATTADRDDTAFLGHPEALGDLVFTEAREGLSGYGMAGREGKTLILLIAAKAP